MCLLVLLGEPGGPAAARSTRARAIVASDPLVNEGPAAPSITPWELVAVNIAAVNIAAVDIAAVDPELVVTPGDVRPGN